MSKADATLTHTLVLQTSATFVEGGDRVRALEGGADSYLVEPMEPEELIANIKALLRLRRAEERVRESERLLRMAASAARLGIWNIALSEGEPLSARVFTQLQPALDPDVGQIAGDPERLQQVVWNLLINAVKFSQQGGQVQIRLHKVNSHAELIVSDSGCGIAPDFLPYVFEPFRQAEASTTRRHGGLASALRSSGSWWLHGGAVSRPAPA